jgi:hypothetical protein
MNSLVVFLPGNIAGKFGWELKWSYLLNVPYALFPMLFVVRLFSQPTPLDKPTPSSPKAKTKKTASFLGRVFDSFLAILLLASVGLVFFRLFASLNSPVEVIRWWKHQVPITFELYFVVDGSVGGALSWRSNSLPSSSMCCLCCIFRSVLFLRCQVTPLPLYSILLSLSLILRHSISLFFLLYHI